MDSQTGVVIILTRESVIFTAGIVLNEFEKLTSGQKGCLRQVAFGRTSKETAIALGLSPLTVDTYIKKAMECVGASNRRDAARLYMEYEQSQSLGSQTNLLELPRSSGKDGQTASNGGWSQMLAPPPLGGDVNRLGPAERTLAILKVATISVVVIAALALLLAGLLLTLR